MKKRVLFVCLGNICRSPSAEAVFKGIVENKNVADNFIIDSAGTTSYHIGEPANAKMKRHARKRGLDLTSIARDFDPENDWDSFDYIIAMDNLNLKNLKNMARNATDLEKLHKMTDFCIRYDYDQVPDPYYGAVELFEQVLDILEDACEGLYNHITR